jgi:molybdate transport system substrate-binding protein
MLNCLARGCGLLITLLFLATACGGGGSAEDDELTVFAAASLTDGFTEIGEAFEEEHGVSVAFNFAGSQALVTQLAEGADAGVFASANVTQMQRADEAGVIASDAEIFARNRLIIIVPDDNPAGLTQPEDLASEGLKITLAAEDVPVGQYTRQMLALLAASPTAPGNFVERVEGNIVSNESNVKQVVTKVQLGEADAGVVYSTDVTAEVRDDVQIIEIPDEYNVIANYPVALVNDGNADLGNAFIDFLLSGEGQQILQEYGFIAPVS